MTKLKRKQRTSTSGSPVPNGRIALELASKAGSDAATTEAAQEITWKRWSPCGARRKYAGLEVFATPDPEDREYVLGLGADRVIDFALSPIPAEKNVRANLTAAFFILDVN